MVLGFEDKKWSRSYTSEIYWTTPFALGREANAGIDRIVKFGAAPCSAMNGATAIPSNLLKTADQPKSEKEAKALAAHSSDPDNDLEKSLADQVNSGSSPEACYDLFVQFLNETKSEWPASIMTEDVTIIWQGPVHKVGRLLVKNSVMTDAQCDTWSNFVIMSGRPDSSGVPVTQGIQPVGEINRARFFVEQASWNNRRLHEENQK